MKDATLIAQEIREKTQRLRNRVTVVKAGDVCASCQRSLIGRPFHAHHCRHFFHRECLEEAMMPFLDDELRAHLKELADTEKRLYSQLQAADRVPTAADRFADERKLRFEKISCEINEIIGSQCPLCGIHAIELIDKPFFTEEQYEADHESWEI